MLSGAGLCHALITSPEESYRMRCVVDCDLDEEAMALDGPQRHRIYIYIYI